MWMWMRGRELPLLRSFFLFLYLFRFFIVFRKLYLHYFSSLHFFAWIFFKCKWYFKVRYRLIIIDTFSFHIYLLFYFPPKLSNTVHIFEILKQIYYCRFPVKTAFKIQSIHFIFSWLIPNQQMGWTGKKNSQNFLFW